ncbi:MAG: hypothetical protein ACLKAO_10170 [Alkaliphilus sp.]
MTQHYKRPAFRVAIISIIAIVAIGIGLISSPKTPPVVDSAYKPAIMIDGEIYWLCPNGDVNIICRFNKMIGKIEKISPPKSKPDENFEAMGYDLLNSGRRAFLKFTVQDVPPVEISRKIKLNGFYYFIYEIDGRFYSESPYIFIDRISEETYNGILKLTTAEWIGTLICTFLKNKSRFLSL